MLAWWLAGLLREYFLWLFCCKNLQSAFCWAWLAQGAFGCNLLLEHFAIGFAGTKTLSVWLAG